MKTFYAVLMILHGLAHLWYVTLSLKLVAFKPEMGWSGESWLLSRILGEGVARPIASVLYSLACLGLVVAGSGMLMKQEWFRLVLQWSAIVSILAIVLFWDGRASRIVEKGLLGLVISAIVVVGLLVFDWPPSIS